MWHRGQDLTSTYPAASLLLAPIQDPVPKPTPGILITCSECKPLLTAELTHTLFPYQPETPHNTHTHTHILHPPISSSKTQTRPAPFVKPWGAPQCWIRPPFCTPTVLQTLQVSSITNSNIPAHLEYVTQDNLPHYQPGASRVQNKQ